MAWDWTFYRESKCYLNTLSVFIGVPHIPVDAVEILVSKLHLCKRMLLTKGRHYGHQMVLDNVSINLASIWLKRWNARLSCSKFKQNVYTYT